MCLWLVSVIQFKAPAESKRFRYVVESLACCVCAYIRCVPKQIPLHSHHDSINIAGPNHNNFNNILFHFNPRQFEHGGQCVLNSKNKGTWGQAVNVPLSTLPLIFGQPSSCTLTIQLSKAGFDVHLNNEHITRLEHRRAIRSGDCSLYLNFPVTDDYGSEYGSTFSNFFFSYIVG